MPSYEIESNDGASWRRCLSVVRDRGLLAARGIAHALCLSARMVSSIKMTRYDFGETAIKIQDDEGRRWAVGIDHRMIE